MRRIVALILVVLFSLQTTASAATPGQLQALNVQPLLSAIESTYIFALITGQADRYTEMHAPSPEKLAINRSLVHPNISRERPAQETLRYGQRGRAPAMLSRIPLPKDAPRDPLAMKKSTPPIAMVTTTSVPKPMSTCPQIITRAKPMLCGGPSPTPLRTPTPTPVPTTPPPTPTPVPTPTPTPVPTPTPTPTPIPVTPTPVPTATPTAAAMSTPSTGINKWWTYQEKPLAGVGKAMVNVGNGNLLVQSDDVDIPERGIDLAFRRTYNSQSTHDAAGTDGATPSLFGNGWTNTFDTHIAYNAAWNIFSVYDIDGARYDYTSNGSGVWVPPAGMQGTTLTWDGNCGYFWTKKNGTLYYFTEPSNVPSVCTTYASGAYPAYMGRIYQIYGRNHSNAITFEYSSLNQSSAENITQIVAQHTDGQSLTLTFAKFGNYTELSSITRPDGQQITYSYDASGNLLFVTRPGNATDDGTRTQTITSLTEEYWYDAGTHEMQCVGGPRFVSSSFNDGSNYCFVYDSNTTSGRLTWINDYGKVNFTPNDGTGAQLQPGSAMNGNSLWRQSEFVYTLNYFPYAVVTRMTDTDGHSTQWGADSSNRVSQTWEWTNINSLWLVTYASWDAQNNLLTSTDPRGNVTSYTYDANGNTLSVRLPSATTSMGTGNPTSYYTYDVYNNVLSYCDPNYVWRTGVTSCSQVPGATYYTYSYGDPNEPFGVLTNAYSPIGYATTITYNSSSEAENYGLPSQVTGASYTQNDGTVRTPTQTFTYDTYGNLTSYNKGNGIWTMTYDALNRVTSRQDPDGVSNYTCYNPDGSVALQRSASQYAADGNAACASVTPANSAGVSVRFDPDGNALTEQHHHGCATLASCQAGLTSKWYDGEDRLVEVRQPQDGNDAYAFPWMTRYIYDISGGQAQSITGGQGGFLAYGNLYKTQECIQGTTVQLHGTVQASPVPVSNTPTSPSYSGTCSFQDLRGNTFDALDRSLTKDEIAAGSTPEQTTAYDCNSEYGLACEKTNAQNQQDTLTYDADGRVSAETFSDGITPNRSYAYDPDGHTTSLTSGTLGTATRTYDADGRLASATDSSAELVPGMVTYGYYGDGLRSSLSLAIPGLSFNQSNLFTYNYRPDGARSSLVSALGSASGSGSGTYAWTYTNAGRELSQSDPLTGNFGGRTFVAKTLTYDAYGRVSGLLLPRNANPFSSYSYDLDDGTMGYSISLTTVGKCCLYQVSTRNEIPGSNAINGQYANGAACTITGGTCTFDARSGQLLSNQTTVPNDGNPYIALHAYGYDAAGRQISDALTCGAGAPIQGTRSYDADNHVIAQAVGADSCTGDGYPSGTSPTYTWDASGHLANYSIYYSASSSTQALSAHWDGDDLLYVATNGILYLYVEKLGFTGNGTSGTQWFANVYDRDQTGTVVNMHWAESPTTAGFGFLNADNVHTYLGQCKSSSPGAGGTCSESQNPPAISAGGPSDVNSETTSTAPLDASREDGYFDGTIAIQGVRAYDPNMNQWTTPDAYSGGVHDPMSQHPYMWNANNPVQYNDPSGYCFEDACVGEIAAGAAIADGALLTTEAVAGAVGDEALEAAAARGVAGIAAGRQALMNAGKDGAEKLSRMVSTGQLGSALQSARAGSANLVKFIGGQVKTIETHIDKLNSFTSAGNRSAAVSATKTISNAMRLIKAAIKVADKARPN